MTPGLMPANLHPRNRLGYPYWHCDVEASQGSETIHWALVWFQTQVCIVWGRLGGVGTITQCRSQSIHFHGQMLQNAARNHRWAIRRKNDSYVGALSGWGGAPFQGGTPGAGRGSP